MISQLIKLSHLLNSFFHKGAFSEGDQVKIKEVSPELAKVMQGSHGGWVRAMEGCLGKAGVVEEVKLGPLRVKVKVTGQSSYVWNPTLLEQAPRQFVVGQQVWFFLFHSPFLFFFFFFFFFF